VASPEVEHAAALLGDRVAREVPLGPRTTYRVGGPAALGVEVQDEADLTAVAGAVAASGVATLVVGRGSNLLVADRGFDGLAIVMGEGLASLALAPESGTVHAGGALALPLLARRTVAAGLSGLEWAVGVPGSVGGGTRMNAGGHGSDVAASIVRARIIDMVAATDTWWPAERLELGFRHSAVTAGHLVAEAEFVLSPGDVAAGERDLAEIVRWRRENQPGGQNAGSVFVNPLPESAGRLVDGLGLKGHRIGSASVSTKHANFIQADDGGSADDVKALIDDVRARVAAAYGIELRPEVQLIGFEEGRA
jgi:UDP-N-acetylmuramate dehydrogenase